MVLKSKIGVFWPEVMHGIREGESSKADDALRVHFIEKRLVNVGARLGGSESADSFNAAAVRHRFAYHALIRTVVVPVRRNRSERSIQWCSVNSLVEGV